jgi:hypothetical protein
LGKRGNNIARVAQVGERLALVVGHTVTLEQKSVG